MRPPQLTRGPRTLLRLVQVECEEDPDGRSVSLLFTNRPLEGGIDAPGSVDYVHRSDVRAYVAMLRSFTETQVVFQEIDGFVESVRLTAEAGELGSVVPSLKAVMEAQCDAASTMLYASSCFSHSSERSDSRLQFLHLRQVMESYLLDLVHDDVFAWLRAQHKNFTEVLAKVLRSMQDLDMEAMGIKECFRCDCYPAIERLSLIDTYRTPLEKVQCLRETTDLLTAAVEEHLEANEADAGQVELSTDDLLDLLLFVIVRAYPSSAHLLTHLTYIQRYHFVNSNTTILGYTLANFQVAVNWLLSRATEGGSHGGESGSDSEAVGGAGRSDTNGGSGALPTSPRDWKSVDADAAPEELIDSARKARGSSPKKGASGSSGALEFDSDDTGAVADAEVGGAPAEAGQRFRADDDASDEARVASGRDDFASLEAHTPDTSRAIGSSVVPT